MSTKQAKKQAAAREDEQRKRMERDFLQGVSRVNIAALFLPPIWGPAHGLWVAIVFYPLWLVADTCFVNAFADRTPLAVTLGVIVFVVLTAVTFAFATVSQKYALMRALSMGVSQETYCKRQRIWAVVSVVVGLVMIGAATYYNVFLNPRLAGMFA
ncbi:MAG: viscotoxin-A3 [Slackia sp.]|nr:viscotoxin-A3 [Slackia sp.]